MRRLLVGAACAVAVAAALVPGAAAADECRGLPVCVPVEGPWVVVPSGSPPLARYLLSCPRRHVVAGTDARVLDRRVDVSFRAETGSPVAGGVSTARDLLFTGLLAGSLPRRAAVFRPYLGCVPTSGGGGRAATGAAQRRPPVRTFAPARPLVFHAATVRLARGETAVATARCARGERLVDAAHALAFCSTAPPDAAAIAAVGAERSVTGNAVVVRASAGALPSGARAEAQALAVCARLAG